MHYAAMNSYVVLPIAKKLNETANKLRHHTANMKKMRENMEAGRSPVSGTPLKQRRRKVPDSDSESTEYGSEVSSEESDTEEEEPTFPQRQRGF